MTDRISTTTTTGYGSRLGNSFKKILFWILLVILSIIMLAWNENNFVEQKAALNEGQKKVVSTIASPLNPDLEGKLVYFHGESSSPAEALKDEDFAVVSDDLKLIRTVEMYQWREHAEEECQDNYGGSETCTTTYDYTKEWNEEKINSDDFYREIGHKNPKKWDYRSKVFQKEPILIWEYQLAPEFVDQLTTKTVLGLKDQEILVPENYQLAQNPQNSTWEEAWESKKLFHIWTEELYIGKNPDEPQIGDLRIRFETVAAGMTSVVGQQSGTHLINYTTSNGRKIWLLENGIVSVEAMFTHAHNANKLMTWGIRAFGLLLMYIGFMMLFELLVTLTKVLPPLANIIQVWTSLIALVLTLMIWWATIAIAWIFVRPIIGIPLLIITLGGGVALLWYKKQKKAE